MNQTIEKSSTSKLRLHYLDRLRGLAALYVVLALYSPHAKILLLVMIKF